MANLFLLLCSLFIAAYCAWQYDLLRRFRRFQTHSAVTNHDELSIAVVVAYRNEVSHITHLCDTLLSQDFLLSKVNLYLVNDDSSDGGPAALKAWCAAAGAEQIGEGQYALPGGGLTVRLLDLQDFLEGRKTVAHKKAALGYAIGQTSAEIILTTDADCELPPDLLQRIQSAFADGVQVVLGPVFNAPNYGFLDHFQALDLAAYQLLTLANVHNQSPILANGACLAFRRSAFTAVNGYEGVDHIPSGDDVLLLEKMVMHFGPAAVRYLANGPGVMTAPVRGWGAFWQQRLRWAGKVGHYRSKRLEFVQALAFGNAVSLLLLVPLALHLRAAALIPLLWLGKMVFEYLNLRAVLTHYGRGEELRYFLPTALLHPFYLVAVGTAALLGAKAKWKGRET